MTTTEDRSVVARDKEDRSVVAKDREDRSATVKDQEDRSVVAKDREARSDVAKDQEDWSTTSKDQEYWSASTKDKKFEVLLQKDQVIMCHWRWTHWRVTTPVTDDCWNFFKTYICITLILLKMLSLVTPIVDDVVVSIIPFSLRGSVEIL